MAQTADAMLDRRQLAAAQAGDQAAFARLVEPLRGQLQAHCYRMLGGLQDAEDALQDALLRAWRGLARFDGRSALSSWLYRIATNVCLTQLERRPKRVLPLEAGFASSDPGDAGGPPLAESVWVEPFPDAVLDRGSAPEAGHEQRETLELAWIAALQHLPPNQRAALLLTEVLDFSAKEAADALETTTASLNSAIQRARKTVDQHVPAQTQQATLRALGDAALSQAVGAYIDAMERADVDAVVSLLAADATWSMPPQPACFRGHEAIGDFLAENPFRWFAWRYRPVRANGQPAVAGYSWDKTAGAYVPHAINVLSFDGAKIAEVTTFLDVTRRGVRGPDFTSFAAAGTFERFGLPATWVV